MRIPLRQPRGAHLPHRAALAGVRHDERPPRARTRGAQRDQQVHAAGGDLVRAVEPLVAGNLDHARRLRRAEQARVRERLQEGPHLPFQLLPHATLRRLEQHPARAGLDALHEQQPPALRGQQQALGARCGAARERPKRQRARHGRTQRLQRVDAVGRESLALGVGEHALRTGAEAQRQLVVGAGLVRRALPVEARKRSGHRTAVGEGLGTTAQPVERDDPRKAQQRVLGAEIELAQPAQDVVARVPSGRRIHDEHRAPLPAQARRHHQRAHAHVAVALEWRDADEVQVVHLCQREQPRPRLRRADHVVVGERQAVVAVGVGVDVADRVARAGAVGLVRSVRGHGAAHAHQLRVLERGRHEARRAGDHRQATEDLLVLDALGAVGAHALHDEVEAVGLVRPDVVVVDRGAQHLARARAERRERERLGAAGQRDGRRRAAVDHADDQGRAAAVLEELLDGIGQRAGLPQSAEDAVELGEAADRDRAIGRAAQRAADEGSHGGGPAEDGAIGARPFGDHDVAECRILQVAPP